MWELETLIWPSHNFLWCTIKQPCYKNDLLFFIHILNAILKIYFLESSAIEIRFLWIFQVFAMPWEQFFLLLEKKTSPTPNQLMFYKTIYITMSHNYCTCLFQELLISASSGGGVVLLIVHSWSVNALIGWYVDQ